MDWSETVISVGKGDEGFDVSPDGRELWTANAQDGTLSVIDLPTRIVTAFGANRLKFTPDGNLVLISRLGDGDLVIYDAKSRKEFKRVPIGHGAAGILIDSEGNRAFISCGPDNYVAVLDFLCSQAEMPASRRMRRSRNQHRATEARNGRQPDFLASEPRIGKCCAVQEEQRHAIVALRCQLPGCPSSGREWKFSFKDLP